MSDQYQRTPSRRTEQWYQAPQAAVGCLTHARTLTCRSLIALLLLLIASNAGALSPLEPSDTSSPRATFESFSALTEEAASRYHAFRDARSPATQKALWQISDKQVREWAAAQILPLPEFTAGYRDRIMDTLDYPPDGSPCAD